MAEEDTAAGEPPARGGWFQVAWSRDLVVGQVAPIRLFGRDLVVYRSESGALHALDAYCRHLGAHLGYVGEVCGSVIRCGYHGWTWGTDGVNEAVPYSDRLYTGRPLGVWPVADWAGVVVVWVAKVADMEPWPLPAPGAVGGEPLTLDSNPLTRRWVSLPIDPCTVGENLVDPWSARLLLSQDQLPTSDLVVEQPDRAHVLHRTRAGATDRDVPVWFLGPGLCVVAPGETTSVLLGTTPNGDGGVDVSATVASNPNLGDRCAAERAALMQSVEFQIGVLEHQRPVAGASLDDHEGVLPAYRAWAGALWQEVPCPQ